MRHTDLLVRLLRHGYAAVERDRRARGGGDVYASRMLGRRAVVLRGERAAASFYDESLVRRSGAFPRALKDLLFGPRAVHGLDGAAHRNRKDLLRSVLPDDTTDLLADAVGASLARAAGSWAGRDVVVADELVRAYGGAVAEWAGCQPAPAEATWVSRELAHLVDGFGMRDRAYPRAWLARVRTDRWLRRRVREVREGRRTPPEGSALAVLAARDDLPLQVAAVELGNLLRPTVAVAWLGTFAAHRLAGHPEWRSRLATAHPTADHLAFAQEVRRTTPFVPVIAARVVRDGTVGDVPVHAGDRLVLDVWGTDTDPGRWSGGPEFDPTRFLGHHPGPFEMVPQGGGDVAGHRCPGEHLTLALLVRTLHVLARHTWEPVRPRPVDLGRMPTLPAYGLPVRVAAR